MPAVTLARNAMATRFEMVLHGPDPARLRAAGEEAFEEIELLESRLSLYRDTSEIAHLNARAATGPVRVSPALFKLLEHANRLHRETGGAFDITIAPLVRCWGFMGGKGRLPEAAEIEAARAKVGMNLVLLDPEMSTVQFRRPGVMLDLGAIGKGYAIAQSAEILRDAGVTSALLHGGTSTVCAIGHPPDSSAWNVAIESGPTPGGPPPELLATVPLRNEAMSVSAVWGKSFVSEGKLLGHVLDPRSGRPAGSALLAAVVLPDAAETDAFSTALLVFGPEGLNEITRLRPGMRSLVLAESLAGPVSTTQGIELRSGVQKRVEPR
jgi:thiamine biosynthesis lipoprotein